MEAEDAANRSTKPGTSPGRRKPIVTSDASRDAASISVEAAPEHPHLAEIAEDAMAGGYSVDREFAFGLELILGALDERLA